MNNAAQRFAAAMRAFGLDRGASVAAAVSGGGDSLALALLLGAWARETGAAVFAFTVDHGLREGSRAEAEKTGGILKARGIPHEILTWQGEKPATHIQERARDMRYRLLAAACRARSIPALAVAHNLEDQIETFWMRLAHGSGLDGLAGMAPSREMDGVRVIRPLLGFTRAELRAVCSEHGAEWIEDPSNVNEKFLRARLRGFEEVLAGEGLTPQRLSQTLQKLEDARDALAQVTREKIAACAAAHDEGYVTFDKKAFAQMPGGIQRRMFARLLDCVAPQDYPAGFDALEALRADALREDFSGRTVAGCDVFPGRSGEIVICREAAAARPEEICENMIWDGRFAVSGYPVGESLAIGVLGEAGISALRKTLDKKSAVLTALEALPFKARKALPALWKGGNPVCVPHLGWNDGSVQGLEKGRVSFMGRVKIV